MPPAHLSESQAETSVSGNNGKTTKSRRRASVACVSCRERRTRCVVRGGESACTQCMDTGQECIIKNDDQRRKPVSKAYVNLLQDRINQLEEALRQKETQPVNRDRDNNNNGQTDNGVPQGDADAAHHEQPECTDFALPTFSPAKQTSSRRGSVPVGEPHSPSESTSSLGSSHSRTSPILHKLLSTQGHVSFDQLAGRLRYFGPTTNCHIYSEIGIESPDNRRQAKEQERRTQRVLSSVSQRTHDYLMALFWQHYNSVIHVIHRGAFEEGESAGGGPFYSGFLHICILAAGYRSADKTRPDMRAISLPGRESTLHREAKYMLDHELERPGGIPSIAALLILGDLEVGCGRDNVGWLYSGMAYRLCFDVGLHLKRSASGLSQKEIEIGRMTLWACVIYDRYWALFLGRPTALKAEDLEACERTQQFDGLVTYQGEAANNLETQVYQALLELMGFTDKILDAMDSVPNNRNGDSDRHVYLRMAALDRDLEKWYARLPSNLQYTAENIKTAPFSLFLLHQQYYCSMILLLRQFTQYGNEKETLAKNGDSTAVVSHLAALSRSTCTTYAGRIAQIFWQHRQRFDTRQIFVTGIQHAGNAATALVGAIASSADQAANGKNMRYLECLTASLKDMAETYQPAERMSTMLSAAVAELKSLHTDPRLYSTVPARRGSSPDCNSGLEFVASKMGSSGRRQQAAGQHQGQTRSYPNNQFRELLKTPLPSPAPTFEPIPSRKPSGCGVTVTNNDDMVVMDDDITNIDGSWPIFSEQDTFAVEGSNFTGHHHPPSAFSPGGWMGAEIYPFPSPLANNNDVEEYGSTNRSLMAFLEEDSDGMAAHGTESSGGGIPMPPPVSRSSGADNSNNNLAWSQQRTTNGNIRRLSSSGSAVPGNQAPSWEPSCEAMHTDQIPTQDSIWTEIIS